MFGGFGRFLTDVYGRTARPAQAESRADEGGCDQFDDDRAEDVERADVVAHSVRTDLVWAGDPEAEFDTMVQRLGPDPDLAGGCERGQPIGSDRGTVSAPRDAAGIAPTPADASVPVSAADDGTRWGVFDLDRDLAGALVVPSPDLAPELPRVCRTCRDFRPAEQGGRGWCTNRWAFTHRRVVDGEDAAPCESSFGSWWLPVDDAWMAAGDVSEHGRPTPLLDHWLPGHREEERQRRGT